MLLECAARLVEVHLGQRRVVRPTSRDHHVVDGPLEVCEEHLQGSRIVGVERRGAHCAELGCHRLQAVGIAAGQDHLGALGPCTPCRLQSDAGAAADHDDGLAAQLRLALRGPGDRFDSHRLSFLQLAMGGAAPSGLRAAAICARSDLSAAT
jgi:hypothetical protein